MLLPADVPTLRWDALASLTYLQNWRLALGGMPYSESFAHPSPLLHVWSLAVEAQLYLLWPVLFMTVLALLSPVDGGRADAAAGVALGRRHGAAVLPGRRRDRLLRTPARASGFLVGAALALAWRPQAWARRLPRPVDALLDAAGLAALVTLVVGFATVSEFDAALFENAGFLRTGAVAAVLVVVATRGHGPVGALLAAPAARRDRPPLLRALPLPLAGLRARPGLARVARSPARVGGRARRGVAPLAGDADPTGWPPQPRAAAAAALGGEPVRDPRDGDGTAVAVVIGTSPVVGVAAPTAVPHDAPASGRHRPAPGSPTAPIERAASLESRASAPAR